MKKLLALVLALVMTLSLCVTSNAAYSDAADVDYAEAVDVMTAIGVFDGMDGKFNPDGILTREQAAKIVTYMLLGKTAADALVTIAAPFSDVEATRWSAGSIAYCYNEGILAGVGEGKFAPTSELTGLAFAKMMLTALGYSAENEGLVGANWSINAAKLALTVGLTDDIEDISLAAPMSRELAAKMALNTLEATMVEYPNASVVKVGDVEVTTSAKASAVANNANVEKIANDNEMQFAEKYFTNLKKAASTDEFLRPATTWTLKTKEVGTYADAPDLTYTTSVKLATVYADLGLTKGIEKAKVLVSTDGAGFSAHTWDLVKGDVESTHGFGGKGTVTDIYYDSDAGTVLVVEVKTYVAEVAAAFAATTTKDAYVVLDSSVNTGVAGATYETDEFAKEDIVLYTYSYKTGDVGVQTMAKAEKVTGELTAYTTDKNITVGGTKYDKGATCATITGISGAMNKDVSVYLDTYGYALYVDASVTAKRAVILAYVDGNTLDSARAKLLFTDGTTETVELKATLTHGNFAGNVKGSGSGFTTDNTHAGVISKYDIVNYTVDSDDKYTLTVAADSCASNSGATTLITKGVSTLAAAGTYNLGTSGSLYANGKTVFLIVDETTSPVSYKAYEGIANVPTIAITTNAATVQVAQYAKTAPIADLVVIQKDAHTNVSTDNKDVFFVKGDSTGETYVPSLNYYEFPAYKQGVESQLKIDATKVAEVDEWTLLASPAYNDKGVVVGYAEYVNATNTTSTNMFYATGTVAEKNGVVGLGASYTGDTLNSATYYAYDKENCKVYFIGTDGELIEKTADSIANDTNNLVWAKMTDGIVTTIYIKVVDAPETITPSSTGTVSIQLVNNSGEIKLQYKNTHASTNYSWSGQIKVTNTQTGYVSYIDLTGGNFAANKTSWTDAETMVGTGNSTNVYQAIITVGGATLASNTIAG